MKMTCDPADVFAVFADGWLFGLWVVGASRIRAVDQTWPAVGSKIHHSVGSWPLLLDDTTSVLSYSPNSRLELQARAWPAGEAKVEITVTPDLHGCTVTMTEDATSGPALLVPMPVRQAMIHWRNTETLQRLAYLAERREGPQQDS